MNSLEFTRTSRFGANALRPRRLWRCRRQTLWPVTMTNSLSFQERDAAVRHAAIHRVAAIITLSLAKSRQWRPLEKCQRCNSLFWTFKFLQFQIAGVILTSVTY